MIILGRHRLAPLVALLAVLVLLFGAMADCQRDDRRKPSPPYNPDRNGGLWLRDVRGVIPVPSGGPVMKHRAPPTGIYGTAGDSTMAGTYLPAEQRTPYLLGQSLPAPASVVDVSRGGQRLIDGDAHNLADDWPGILAERPWYAIFVLVGTDDLYGSPSADWKAAYARMRDQATEKGVQLVPCLILPLVQAKRDLYLREPQREELNHWLRVTFADTGYVDTEAALAMPGSVGLNPIYDNGDGMHLNAAGAAVLARIIRERA